MFLVNIIIHIVKHLNILNVISSFTHSFKIAFNIFFNLFLVHHLPLLFLNVITSNIVYKKQIDL